MSMPAMWWARSCVLAMLILLLLPPASALAQGQEGDALIVPTGQRAAGSLSTISRPIEIYGDVPGDVTTWSGSIRIAGHVDGDVISYSGLILIDAQAQINGHVLSLAGDVINVEGSQVGGQLIRGGLANGPVANLLDLTLPLSGVDQNAGGLPRILFSIAMTMLVLALSTLSALTWPRRLSVAASILASAPLRSLALGMLTTLLLFLLALPSGALLALTLFGLPLVPLLLLLLQLPYVFGLTTLGLQLGRRLLGVAPLYATPLGTLLLLLPPAILASISPVVGLALFYIIAGTGLGAVIISRAGTLPSTSL